MSIKSKLILIISILLVIIGSRAGLMWYGINSKDLNTDEMYVIPGDVVELPVSQIRSDSKISIGYAEFDKPADGTLNIHTEPKLKMVVIELDDLSFKPILPWETSDYSDWDISVKDGSHLFGTEWLSDRILGSNSVNPEAYAKIDVDLFCAQAKPPALWETIFMSSDQYTRLLVRLMIKTLCTNSLKQIIPFESEKWVGAVYLREKSEKVLGHIDLVTRDRKLSQIIMFEFKDPDKVNLDRIWHFLSTYSYTFDSFTSPEELLEQVEKAVPDTSEES